MFKVVSKFFQTKPKTGVEYFPNPKNYGTSLIHPIEDGNKKIHELLQSDHPCMIGRFGASELLAVHHYHSNGLGTKDIVWSDFYKRGLNKGSGFFPTTDEMITKFCKLFIEHIKSVDVLGVWHVEGEETMVKEYLSNTYLTPLRALEPYYSADPWSKVLKNKKVLLIHPFAKTIRHQFDNVRDKLFGNKNVLPEFSLDILQAVQSLGTEKTRFATWFDAYDFMCGEIQKRDFDIAIIGAGAYGLSLAHFVKSIGKKAIHLGGATQILFGIKGRRWDNHPVISGLYNDYWTRPSEDETPAKENLLEDGCYW